MRTAGHATLTALVLLWCAPAFGAAPKNDSNSQGPTPVQGAMPPQQISAVVRSHMARLRHCYEAALMRAPNLQGRVTIAFTIGTSGAVVSARVDSSTMGDPSVGACLEVVFRSMIFPAPSAGVVNVTYPFNFSADQGSNEPPPSRGLMPPRGRRPSGR